MIKTTVLLLAASLCSAAIFSQSPADLFISEYVEGSSNNKYIEVFNGTGISVDLSDYEIHVFSNGNGNLEDPDGNIGLMGSLSNNEVFVVAHSGADIYSNPNLVHGSLNFNGNDAVCLYKISEDKYLDVFGAIGIDPGDYWESGELATRDQTLIRKATVSCGSLIEDNNDDFYTLATEWVQSGQDDVSDLGMHTFGSVTAVTEVQKEVILNVSPNPVIDKLYVETTKEVSGIKVYSFAGEEVFSHEGSVSEGLDVSGLPQGFYLLSVKFTDGTAGSLKFVKR